MARRPPRDRSAPARSASNSPIPSLDSSAPAIPDSNTTANYLSTDAEPQAALRRSPRLNSASPRARTAEVEPAAAHYETTEARKHANADSASAYLPAQSSTAPDTSVRDNITDVASGASASTVLAPNPTWHQKLLATLRSSLPANLHFILNPSLTLENTGSVARDHLASERTFLAYVRTSLTVASAGVGASHFLPSFLHAERALLTSTPRPFISLGAAVHDQLVLAITRRVVWRTAAEVRKAARGGDRDLWSLVLADRSVYHVLSGCLRLAFPYFVAGLGCYRYFKIQGALIDGRFLPAQRTAMFMSAVLVSLVVVIFGILTAVPH